MCSHTGGGEAEDRPKPRTVWRALRHQEGCGLRSQASGGWQPASRMLGSDLLHSHSPLGGHHSGPSSQTRNLENGELTGLVGERPDFQVQPTACRATAIHLGPRPVAGEGGVAGGTVATGALSFIGFDLVLMIFAEFRRLWARRCYQVGFMKMDWRHTPWGAGCRDSA